MTLSLKDLPARAFDSEEQRAETAEIFARYNQESASTPPVDAAFARLAETRVTAHPLRYYVVLPVARVLDMWFRPRIEYIEDSAGLVEIRAHIRGSRCVRMRWAR